METSQTTTTSTGDSKGVRWIVDAIASLYVDQTALELGVASEEKIAFYDRVASNPQKMILEAAAQIKTDQIRPLMSDFLSELMNYSEQPFTKLAVDIKGSEIFFWIEINEYSSELERDLILAEAKVNSKYFGLGFHVSSTIVESCDQLPTPPNYHILLSEDSE